MLHKKLEQTIELVGYLIRLRRRYGFLDLVNFARGPARRDQFRSVPINTIVADHAYVS